MPKGVGYKKKRVIKVSFNKKDKSPGGGLSASGRKKAKTAGMNLKAPVSREQANKSPKAAARRKSFCARMSGVKGPTSKGGKLTRKGLALKKWECGGRKRGK